VEVTITVEVTAVVMAAEATDSPAEVTDSMVVGVMDTTAAVIDSVEATDSTGAAEWAHGVAGTGAAATGMAAIGITGVVETGTEV
jgi:hypothetical protein